MARIIYVSLHTSPLDAPGSKDAGGMNVVEVHNARALAERGYQVEIVTRRDNTTLPDVIEIAPGVTVRQLTAGPAEPLAKSAQEAYIAEFSAALAQLEPAELIHSQHWMSGVAALPVAKQWGVPHVQSFHSVAALPGAPLSDGEPPESAGRNAGERLIAAQSDLIVAVSQYEADTIISRCGADPAKVVIVNPGVDLDFFRPRAAAGAASATAAGTSAAAEPEAEPAAAPTEEREAEPRHECGSGDYLLFAGRLQPLKGPQLALAALAAVPCEMRPYLVITGDVSKDFAHYLDELKQLASDLGISDRVRWCGSQSRDNLATLMRDAKIMLVPSYSETFGLVALEANASGVPVIAAAAGGLCEAIADGETGIIMADRDPVAWAQAITLLLADDTRRVALGAAGRERATQYSWQHAAAGLDKHYREILGQPLPEPPLTTSQPQPQLAARQVANTAGNRSSQPAADSAAMLPEPFAFGDRVLFLHAHPDDETLATGALITHLVSAGVACQLLTATRGEAGEIVPGALTTKPAGRTLEEYREAELAGALKELGITAHAYLGTAPARAEGAAARRYRDSGMRWINPGVAGPAADAPADSLTSSDFAAALADVLALITAWQPTKLISYNPQGGYGHPDHVRMHQLTAAASAVSRIPAYQIEHSQDAATHWYELEHTRDTVARALGHHVTQLTVTGNLITHSGGQQEEITTAIGLSPLAPAESGEK